MRWCEWGYWQRRIMRQTLLSVGYGKTGTQIIMDHVGRVFGGKDLYEDDPSVDPEIISTHLAWLSLNEIQKKIFWFYYVDSYSIRRISSLTHVSRRSIKYVLDI